MQDLIGIIITLFGSRYVRYTAAAIIIIATIILDRFSSSISWIVSVLIAFWLIISERIERDFDKS